MGKIIRYSLIVLFTTLAGIFAVLSIQFSPRYVVRLVRYNVADVFDYKHFYNRTLQPSTRPALMLQKIRENYVESLFEDKVMSGQYADFNDWVIKSQTSALIFIQHDTVIYEKYFNGFHRDSYFHSQSMAKSFISALIGFAIQDGLISNINDPVTKYIPELEHRDPRFNDISIRNLLTMQSGLKYNEDYLPLLHIHAPWHDEAVGYYHGNVRKWLLKRVDIDRPPGNDFQYCNYNTSYLGLIIERVTRKTVSEYLSEKLWSQMMEYDALFSIDRKKAGFEYMPSRLIARAIDYARFGQLYINYGRFYDEQILPETWVTQSTTEYPTNATEWDAGFSYYGDEHYYYKYQWWGQSNIDSTYQFFASGNLGQTIYIIPHLNMVIVRCGMSNKYYNEGDLWHIEKCIRYRPFNESLKLNGVQRTLNHISVLSGSDSTALAFDEKFIHNKAFTYLHAGETEDALSLFKFNIKNFPDSWRVYKSMGDAYSYLNNQQSAYKAYRKALELNPENLEIKNKILN